MELWMRRSESANPRLVTVSDCGAARLISGRAGTPRHRPQPRCRGDRMTESLNPVLDLVIRPAVQVPGRVGQQRREPQVRLVDRVDVVGSTFLTFSGCAKTLVSVAADVTLQPGRMGGVEFGFSWAAIASFCRAGETRGRSSRAQVGQYRGTDLAGRADRNDDESDDRGHTSADECRRPSCPRSDRGSDPRKRRGGRTRCSSRTPSPGTTSAR